MYAKNIKMNFDAKHDTGFAILKEVYWFIFVYTLRQQR